MRVLDVQLALVLPVILFSNVLCDIESSLIDWWVTKVACLGDCTSTIPLHQTDSANTTVSSFAFTFLGYVKDNKPMRQCRRFQCAYV